MAAKVIEIELTPFEGKEYITVQDAGRYLRISFASVDFFASRGRMKMERVDSRWLLEWESVQVFSRELRSKRQADYEVRITRPAMAKG